MQLKEMFDMQRKLDERIKTEHENSINFNDKIVATLVELSEFSNEVRWFKKWSNKSASPKEVILEEGVDILHFLLSLGNDIAAKGHDESVKFFDYTSCNCGDDLSNIYIYFVGEMIELFYKYNKFDSFVMNVQYYTVMSIYLDLMKAVGFNEKDIETAYYKKNEINHKRQDNNY